MAVYRPSSNSKIWWYEFIFQGQRIRESSKSRSKTVAKDAEKTRRRELEDGYNGIKRRDRAKVFSSASEEWLSLKRATLAPSSIRIETDNLKHLTPHFGKRLVTDIDAKDVSRYQQSRLSEGASPKTINLEAGTLRAILRRNRVWAEIQQDVRMLPTRDDVGRALAGREEAVLLAACRQSRSRSLYPAVMLALNTGMRYSEIRLLQWKQIDFISNLVTVGRSKTQAGTGRVIPLNARITNILLMWAEQFPNPNSEHFVFPFERCGGTGELDKFGFNSGVVYYDTDPARPVGDWKEAWEKAKKRAAEALKGVAEGKPQQQRNAETTAAQPKEATKQSDSTKPASLRFRFHDLRHTAVTRLLEGGIPYPVVANMMGWSAATAIRMAKRYGHIGSQALRDAAEVLGRMEIPAESLKKSPNLTKVEGVAVQ